MTQDLQATKPWLPSDRERKTKFEKGTIGETSDRWREQPNLEPCYRGNYRAWRILKAPTYQSQLFCRYWKLFINPSGFSCHICTAAPNDKTPPDGKYFPGQPPRE